MILELIAWNIQLIYYFHQQIIEIIVLFISSWKYTTVLLKLEYLTNFLL